MAATALEDIAAVRLEDVTAVRSEDLKIGIAGVGMVGGAMRRYFERKALKPFLYDKGKALGSIEEVNKADVIFICVPTPFDRETGFDLSYVEGVCSDIAGEKIVVIKSTVVPGTTQSLQRKYPQHKFLFNPEFLVEARADRDMQNPDRQIIGYTEKSYYVARTVLDMVPKAPFERIIESTEAEMVKYFGNTFLAVKVIFANQIYELCQRLDIDYGTVAECASADKRIGSSHLDVHHGGYLGYGGKCFPKDMRALIQFANAKGIDLRLHKMAEQINDELLESEGVSV